MRWGSWIRADRDRGSKALEQREVDMNIEPLCLEGMNCHRSVISKTQN
jgi:hypothetical protein